MVSNQEWIESQEFVRAFAKQAGCTSIILETANPAIWDLIKSLGFSESTRRFSVGV